MLTGKIKFFNQSKEYGFIEAEDGKDYFFHERAVVEGTPVNNVRVQFDVGSNDKGPCAVNVCIL